MIMKPFKRELTRTSVHNMVKFCIGEQDGIPVFVVNLYLPAYTSRYRSIFFEKAETAEGTQIETIRISFETNGNRSYNYLTKSLSTSTSTYMNYSAMCGHTRNNITFDGVNYYDNEDDTFFHVPSVSKNRITAVSSNYNYGQSYDSAYFSHTGEMEAFNRKSSYRNGKFLNDEED